MSNALMSNALGRKLGRNDLIASYHTISGAPLFKPARFSFAERVAAAAAAGYEGIGMLGADYSLCRERGLSDAEMRRIADDHGIQVAELEFVRDWWRDDERVKRARAGEERLYAAAEAFGARHMNVGSTGNADEPLELERAAAGFAAMCERAAAYGLLVAIEFFPWGDIPDPATAWEIVRRSGAPNGGILIDFWHYYHGPADPAQLRAIPPERIVAIQIDDAAPLTSRGLMYDTMQRPLVGEGILDVEGLIRLLDSLMVAAPYSVEIVSSAHIARPLEEAARLSHDTTRAALARARH